jgi:hypothetical protein
MRRTRAPYSLTRQDLTITHTYSISFSLNYQLYNLHSVIHPYSFVSHPELLQKAIRSFRTKIRLHRTQRFEGLTSDTHTHKKQTRTQGVQMSTLDAIERVGTHQTCWHYGTLIIDTVFQHHTIREIHFRVNASSYRFSRFAGTKTESSCGQMLCICFGFTYTVTHFGQLATVSKLKGQCEPSHEPY